MPPPEKTVLVHDSDNCISIHTSTGFSNAVHGAASPEESVEEILKLYPPSAISKTYILASDATYDVLKRTLSAFKDANYPNIKMIESFSYMATAALDGTDCEYDEGETILYYTDKYAESTDKGISMVLKKVDQLFQIVEHIGNNVHEVLNYYPEIKKVIIAPSNSSTAWNMVFVNKIIELCKISFNIQHEYVFNDHCRVKPITGIKILINDGTKIEPLNLFYEPIPLTKTIELTLAPEQHAIFIWVSHAMEPYIQDSSYEVASRPGYMTKLAFTVSIDETILPQFSYRVIAHIPQVMTEIVFDSSTGKYAGNLVKLTSQKNVIADCSTPDDVFAAFEALPTTDHHVGIIINYKNKFDMTVHKTIMSLIPEHTKFWIIPLQTALHVDLGHSAMQWENIAAVWYHNTNSEVFYIEKGKIGASEKNINENAVKKVMVVTRNAVSKTMSQKIQQRFPAATISYSNRETLSSKAHHDIVWLLLKSRQSYRNNMIPDPFGVRLTISLNDMIVKTSRVFDYDISCWTEVLPVDKAGCVVTVDMKHFALEDPVRLHEIKIESSKNNREAVIRLSMNHQFVAEVDMTLQKITAKNTAKNTQVIYTIIPDVSGLVFQAVYQVHADPISRRFDTFESLVKHIADLAPLSSVVAVIDFISYDITVAEGKKRRDLLFAAGFNKVVPWNMYQLSIERLGIAKKYDQGECMAVFTDTFKKVVIRQNNNVKCLADIEFKQPCLDKFKIQTVQMFTQMFLDSSFLMAMPRHPNMYPPPFKTQLWNTYWAIANGKNVVVANASLEFIVEGPRRSIYKTEDVTLPHEFTVETEVETADNIKVQARCLPKIALEEPTCIATFDTTSLHDRVIAITIIVKDLYNITAKFKPFAPGHKKRVITRIVLMKQGETGIDRQTFSRGDKVSVSDFALPSMLVALETYAHPELSAVVFIVAEHNFVEYSNYVELAQRFRFANIQICHEAVIDANRLLYGSEIDAEVGETMFIMNSSKHSKNFNKSYVIKKEANRFKLLKPEADTIENLRKEFPDVTRITYEGLNPLKDDASSSPIHSYLFARVNGTLRRTAVADINGEANVIPLSTPTLIKPMDEIDFIIKFGKNKTIYTLKRNSFKNVLLDVGRVTKVKMSSKRPASDLCFDFPSYEFLAVEGRKVALKLNVDNSLIASIKCYTTNIVFELTPDNRLIVYSNKIDMLIIGEYPAYVSLKNLTPRFGHEAIEDMSSHPERVAYDLPYMMSKQFNPECPKNEWKFTSMMNFDPWPPWIPNKDLRTPNQLLTMLLKAVFITHQREASEIIDTVYFLVPLNFDIDSLETDEIANALKVKIIVDRINNATPQKKSACIVM